MSLHRYAAKRDAGERAIIDALQQAGCLVEQLSGSGMADLLVARGWGPVRTLYLLEIKQRKGRLTEAQSEKIAEGWPVTIARTPEQALHAVGVCIVIDEPNR